MLQEHPLTSKILRVHTALFSVAGACIMVLVWPQKPLGQTAFCRVVNAVGTIAIFVLIAVGFILIAMAFAARKRPSGTRATSETCRAMPGMFC
ncbi:hypothetical protein NIA69_02620 [Gemmiger formicilis]|nr:hypothetical protein [Gemmiger formicilis]